jgi:hypothetical protein
MGMEFLATAFTDPTVWTFVFLAIAIGMALGFEFVNGFHDTANAVATVIYTNTLKPTPAVVWSGFWNFIGVMTSSGAVAFGIVALLPVELVLNVVFPACLGDRLECGNLVARAAGLEFAHTHWVDYRRGRGQRTDRPIAFDNGWSELGEGAGCRYGAAHLAGCGFLCGCARAYRDADRHQESETFRVAREGKSSTTVDPRNFDADLHGG